MSNPFGVVRDIGNIGDDLSKASPTDTSHMLQDFGRMGKALLNNDTAGFAKATIDLASDSMNVPNLWDDMNQLRKDL